MAETIERYGRRKMLFIPIDTQGRAKGPPVKISSTILATAEIETGDNTKSPEN